MTLYELTDEYRQLLEMAEDPDTDPDVLRDTMEAIGGEIEAKADGYAMVMKELEAQDAAIKTEVDRLNNRRLAIANHLRTMKLTLTNAMIETGKKKFKTTLFSFNIQKNPASVVLETDDYSKIPAEYWKMRDPEIDKAALKKDLQAGKELPGVAHLSQGESLRIK